MTALECARVGLGMAQAQSRVPGDLGAPPAHRPRRRSSELAGAASPSIGARLRSISQQHPLAAEVVPLGPYVSQPDPDTPATDAPAIAWTAVEADVSVADDRPARAMGARDRRPAFPTVESMGRSRHSHRRAPARVSHLLIRRHGVARNWRYGYRLSLAPAMPRQAVRPLPPSGRRAPQRLGSRPPPRPSGARSAAWCAHARATKPYVHAHRQAAMLCVHDLAARRRVAARHCRAPAP